MLVHNRITRDRQEYRSNGKQTVIQSHKGLWSAVAHALLHCGLLSQRACGGFSLLPAGKVTMQTSKVVTR
jgi:hypothetical protein